MSKPTIFRPVPPRSDDVLEDCPRDLLPIVETSPVKRAPIV
jgi:hypothetical protein